MDDQQNWPVWATQPIILEHYDTSWPQRAATLIDELTSLYNFDPVVFEHIGSTSVPDFPAKPIIDLMIEVESFETIDEIEHALLKADWHMIPPVLDIRDQRRVFVKVADNKRYAHLHIVTKASNEMARHLAFRNLLRSNPAVAQEYLQLKRELAHKYRDDRDAYSNGKNDFIRDVLNKNA